MLRFTNSPNTFLCVFLFLFSFQSFGQQLRKSATSPEIIRCYTVESEAANRLLFPERGTDADFEKWIAPLIEKRTAKAKGENGSPELPVITIPLIFHIITSGSGVTNITAARVQAQVNQLNIDFRNLAGSTNGVAADAEIEFCLALVDPSNNLLAEPGIRRVTTYGAGPFSNTTINGTIKPATSWDPSNYCNIWIADISGGLLGWAQFPDASGLGGLNASGGSANTDGVVCLYSSIGSIASPFNSGIYAAGRTLTHELGHWLGLRHIWGDGGCGVDDYCNDTPLSDAANYGCPVTNSCTDPAPDPFDMVENYMDYTNDACMNIFTTNQKTRMRVVMDNSPRRLSLKTSTKCNPPVPPVPVIGFALDNGSAVYEGASCTYQDIPVELNISLAPSANAVVTFGTTGATTATLGTDFLFFPASVTFNAGSTAPKFVTLRVYNDIIIEPNEIVELSFTISTTGNAISAVGGLATHDITILNGSGPVTVLNENFEGAHAGWTTTGNAGSNLFLYDVVANANSTYWTINPSNTTKFAYSNDDQCNCNKANDKLTSPVFSLVGFTGATMTFDHAFSDYSSETAGVRISTGGAFTTLQAITQTQSTSNTPWINGVTVNLTPYIGQPNCQIQFFYNDGNIWGYGLAIDNVKVVGTGASPAITTYATDTKVSCGPYTWINGITYASNNNTATWTIPNTSGCDSIITLNLTINSCSATLNVSAFIEGYYIPESTPPLMNPAIYTNRLYSGSSSPGNPTDVDSIVVQLRHATTHSLVQSFKAMLNTSGNLTCTFPSSVIGNSYYIVLKHKNSLELWSAAPVAMTASSSYSFKTSASQAYGYGSDPAQKQLAPGLFGLLSGDINQDGLIDGFDFVQFEVEVLNSGAGQFQLNSDLNGDGFVDGFDYPVFDVNSSAGAYMQAP